MNFDRRSEAREAIRLQVAFDGGDCGLTRDISAGGLFIEFNGNAAQDGAIGFSIALSDDDRPIRLRAEGQVVRVESRGNRCGVGVRLVSATLESVAQPSTHESIH